MDGTFSGQRRMLAVEREYEVVRMEEKLLAAAYEELGPWPRRRVLVSLLDDKREVATGPRRRALVGT
jgi:hypothetical protein